MSKLDEGIKDYSKEQLNNIYNGDKYPDAQPAVTPTVIIASKIISGAIISGGGSFVSSYITSAWAKCR
ncbi:Uncharacterised protein [Streptococcus pneumoniae]|uniref:hypothetical protein n=1 Tax=uncultured Parvimonas sp. TaxID=747372 RepID=UPI00061DA5FA|nr:hypothetical protein [uncultured Parvimonas sp.]MDS2496794.1 hypothetical protein [Streptococcus pneumoniae]MDS5043547.1 hypothetical protein [Streptococcus pneumoniae]MDS5124683.1 hypothetical protein [Streptococcus pneumoniae]MDS5623294.1 hypothetical protein [Streptococcus pneumoniae]MDS8957221.1 hypothetical protein [Streptococcus pneumoniae]